MNVTATAKELKWLHRGPLACSVTVELDIEGVGTIITREWRVMVFDRGIFVSPPQFSRVSGTGEKQITKVVWLPTELKKRVEEAVVSYYWKEKEGHECETA